MSHQPPVPEANQSPYPLQEPPHLHAQTASEADDEGAADRSPANGHLADLLEDLPELSGRTIVAVGGAIALGVAATVGALLFARRSPRKAKAKAKRTQRGRGKRAR